MRILIVAESLGGSGGIQRSTLFAAEHFVRCGHHVSLIYGDDGDLSPAWREIAAARLCLGSVQLPRRSPLLSLRRRVSAWRFVRSDKPQVVYCHSMNQLPLANFVGRRFGIPIVFHLRTPPPIASARNRRRMLVPTFFIAVSEATKAGWLPLRSDLYRVCEVIPNGVDLKTFAPATEMQRTTFRRALGIPAGASVAVFVGRFSQDKGILDLVRAHRSLSPASRPWLVLAGAPFVATDTGYDTLVRQMATEKTIFLGYRSDVAAVIGAGDAVVLPSLSEPFGRVVIESLACDIPVIGSDIDGIAEILAPDFADLLFAPGDVEGLARLLESINDPGFARRFTGVCRRVAEKYDLLVSNARIENALERVVQVCAEIESVVDTLDE